ncbi:MAG: ROK family protein [Candidatus Riflebacteria bacterium]|nr:ROK family protein [Candidatus Riflebacteria bacterium]
MRLGIDLGGTKTEIIALNDNGKEIYRKRVNTESGSYEGIVSTIAGLVTEAESVLGKTGSVGVGIPGTISSKTGCVKNANTNALNGHPLDRDLSQILKREVRCMNDANCLALSEAVDGAGAGYNVVFAVILGTGCGSGIAVGGKHLAGHNLVAGEWGHNPLPWMKPDEYPGPACWCGKKSCIEKWISGKGFEEDYSRTTENSSVVTSEQIVAMARKGEKSAQAALDRYIDRLARSLAHVINILDPDIIVLGGGMSNVTELYEMVPKQLFSSVFGQEVQTQIVKSKHGDSSGVRGAAWLWTE